ncbi:MAG: PASTA domain-containing protein, partial [Egibacteraceae bacterium]
PPPAPAPEPAPPPAPAPEPAPPPAPEPLAPAQVAVPDVAGQPSADAAGSLGSAGFQVQEASQASNTVASGSVIATDPPAGTQRESGSAVTMVVSSGPSAAVDLVAVAPGAMWSSGAGALTFGEPADPATSSPSGFGRESATPPPGSRALEAKPDDGANGFVVAVYQLPAPLIAGDRFTSGIAFTPSAAGSQVTFELLIAGADGQALLAASDDSTDGLLGFDVDLTQFAGAQRIALRVRATTATDPSPAVWVNPTVQGPQENA